MVGPTSPLLEELTPSQCRRLLEEGRLGRVGVTMNALPAVLPVNYVLFAGDVIFRTVRGTKLDAATAAAVVAFEVDSFDPDRRDGWSVMICGVAREVTDPDELSAVRALPLESWALGDVADRYVAIDTARITGRRIQHRQSQ